MLGRAKAQSVAGRTASGRDGDMRAEISLRCVMRGRRLRERRARGLATRVCGASELESSRSLSTLSDSVVPGASGLWRGAAPQLCGVGHLCEIGLFQFGAFRIGLRFPPLGAITCIYSRISIRKHIIYFNSISHLTPYMLQYQTTRSARQQHQQHTRHKPHAQLRSESRTESGSADCVPTYVIPCRVSNS